MRSWSRLAAGLVIAAGCGGGSDGPPDTHGPTFDAPPDAPTDAAVDAPIDAPPVPLDDQEPADCGGVPLIARGGDLAMVVSALAIPQASASADLDGDGTPDNKLAGIRSLAAAAIDDGLAAGTFTVAIELFDRGADPDACLKLALYRGACAAPPCSYTDASPDTISLDPAAIGPGGEPRSRLRAMSTDAAAQLDTGAGLVFIELPVTDGITMPLPLTVLQGAGAVVGAGPAARLQDLALHGVLQPQRLDALASPELPQIGATPADTMLDVIYANVFGPLLALPSVPGMGCRTADIDVDGDGLEAFCDDTPNDDEKRVTSCIDGDGTQIADGDGGNARCTDAQIGGVPRFRDGISAAIVLSAQPATITP